MLNQKLGMIELSEKGALKAATDWKVGLLGQAVSQIVNPEGRFLKEVRSATWGTQEW